MATQLPETLQDIQEGIHALTSSDPTTPATGDDQWKTRLVLINRAIQKWERQDVEWRELFATAAYGTIAANTTQYPVNEDSFRAPGSLLRIHTGNSIEYIDVIEPRNMMMYQGNGRVCYFTGNPRDGYILNLGWSPVAGESIIGAKFDYDFWQTTERLAKPSDKPQMSNPEFIVFWVSAQELLFNGRTTMAQQYLSEATEIMDNMKIRNEMMPSYAQTKLDDVDVVRNQDIWGE